jgi:Tfp pilus assembly protein PilX
MSRFAHRHPQRRRTQRGMSLLLGLILLVALTLLAFSAFTTSNTNLRAVGNEQFRKEATGAAQVSIETVLSTPDFMDTSVQPPAASETVNGTTYTVNHKVACIGVVDVPTNTLDPTNPDDFVCIPSSASKNSGIFTTSSVEMKTSLCSDTRYSIQAQVPAIGGDDTGTGTSVTLEQGAAVRMSKADSMTYCK